MAEEEIFTILFEQEGPLGIEFVDLSPPYEVRSGLAGPASALKKGDFLVQVNETSTKAAGWESLKPLLVARPAKLTFRRPAKHTEASGWGSWGKKLGGQASGLLSGQTTSLFSTARGLGSSLVVGLSEVLKEEDNYDSEKEEKEAVSGSELAVSVESGGPAAQPIPEVSAPLPTPGVPAPSPILGVAVPPLKTGVPAPPPLVPQVPAPPPLIPEVPAPPSPVHGLPAPPQLIPEVPAPPPPPVHEVPAPPPTAPAPPAPPVLPTPLAPAMLPLAHEASETGVEVDDSVRIRMEMQKEAEETRLLEDKDEERIRKEKDQEEKMLQDREARMVVDAQERIRQKQEERQPRQEPEKLEQIPREEEEERQRQGGLEEREAQERIQREEEERQRKELEEQERIQREEEELQRQEKREAQERIQREEEERQRQEELEEQERIQREEEERQRQRELEAQERIRQEEEERQRKELEAQERIQREEEEEGQRKELEEQERIQREEEEERQRKELEEQERIQREEEERQRQEELEALERVQRDEQERQRQEELETQERIQREENGCQRLEEREAQERIQQEEEKRRRQQELEAQEGRLREEKNDKLEREKEGERAEEEEERLQREKEEQEQLCVEREKLKRENEKKEIQVEHARLQQENEDVHLEEGARKTDLPEAAALALDVDGFAWSDNEDDAKKPQPAFYNIGDDEDASTKRSYVGFGDVGGANIRESTALNQVTSAWHADDSMGELFKELSVYEQVVRTASSKTSPLHGTSSALDGELFGHDCNPGSAIREERRETEVAQLRAETAQLQADMAHLHADKDQEIHTLFRASEEREAQLQEELARARAATTDALSRASLGHAENMVNARSFAVPAANIETQTSAILLESGANLGNAQTTAVLAPDELQEQLSAAHLMIEELKRQMTTLEVGNAAALETLRAANDAREAEYAEQIAVLRATIDAKADTVEDNARVEVDALREDLQRMTAEKEQFAATLQQDYESKLNQLRADVAAVQAAKESAIEEERHARAQQLEEAVKAWEDKERAWKEEMKQRQEELNEAVRKTEEANRKAESFELDVSLRKRYELKIASLQAELQEEKAKRDQDDGVPRQSHYEYDVTFALDGPLGLEFRDAIGPPYVVTKIHPGCVASDLNIQPEDELTRIGMEPVPPRWGDFVAKMASRPVVATFKRAEAAGGVGANATYLEKMKNINLWGKSATDSSRLQDELLEAKRQRDEAQNILKSTEDVLSTLMQKGADGVVEEALASKQKLEKQVRDSADELEAEKQKYSAQAQQHASLLQQFEALQSTTTQLRADAEEKQRLQAEVTRLEHINNQWQVAAQAQKDKLSDLHDAHAELEGKQKHGGYDPEMRLRLEGVEQKLRLVTQNLEDALQLNREKEAEIEQLQSMLETFKEEQMFGEGRDNAELEVHMSENRDLRRQLDELRAQMQKNVEVRQGRDDRYFEMEAEVGNLRTDAEVLQSENIRLRQELRNAQDVSHQAIGKLRRDMEDRPFLIDKRLCVQMLMQYFNAPYDTRPEILCRMADSLGFTNEDREQLGIKKGVLGGSQRNSGTFGDAFLDFLQEEAM